MSMRKALAFALTAAVVGGAALLAGPHLPFRCSAANRLDRLLGGGPPVCLGGSSAQLDRYSSERPGGSSCTLETKDQGREYWYSAQEGHGVCRAPGRIVTGCVTLRDAGKAGTLARSATAGLGGSWRITVVTTPLGLTQHLWTSSEGLVVSNTASFDGSRTVCVADKRPRT